MSILTADAIKQNIASGDIVITPYDERNFGPNSYNVHLGSVFYYIDNKIIDLNKPIEYIEIEATPEKGFTCNPGMVLLGRTVEYTATYKHVPRLEGRSSLARLGLQIHMTAGFGDIGYKGKWTLEISCQKPFILYPGMSIGQIYFEEVSGKIEQFYKGKYQGGDTIRSMYSLDDLYTRQRLLSEEV